MVRMLIADEDAALGQVSSSALLGPVDQQPLCWRSPVKTLSGENLVESVGERVYENALGLIGGTPLVRLNRLPAPGSARVLVKMESRNPGGSVKDRAALAMVEPATSVTNVSARS